MKNLTKISIFAVTLVMAFTASFTLTGCSSDVEKPDQPVDGPKEGFTVFSTDANDTRTTIDHQALFYWQSEQVNGTVTNDQIWIDETGTSASFSLQSSSSEFYQSNRMGKFYFRGLLDKSSYKLSYTGFQSTTGDKVTIASEQVQSRWGNAEHIGKSGDCATATATKKSNGNYSFTLEHKANYLIFQPYAPASSNTNPYTLVDIEIVDTEGKVLAGTFPLKYNGLQTSGGSNTKTSVRVTCAGGFKLPTAASNTNSVYAVVLPRGAAEGGRALQVRYRVNTVSDGNFIVYQDISGNFEVNGARLIRHNLSVPALPTVADFVSDGNGLFGGIKFKPAFLFRYNGNVTTNSTLKLEADPFILLQYNKGSNTASITEFQKRMFFTWNELAEIFGHIASGYGSNWKNNITNTVTIGGKNYTLPIWDNYSKLTETPNYGRATVNYYPASFAAVIVDLSGDATYATLGWNKDNQNQSASHIAGYLFFPDEAVILDANIKVASLNGRWNNTASNLTADQLRNYVNHGCMFLPAAGGWQQGYGWFYRGTGGLLWSGQINAGVTSESMKFGYDGDNFVPGYYNRLGNMPVVLIEQ